jgi:hypothetical protein
VSPLFFSPTGVISIGDDGQDPEDLDVEFVGVMPLAPANHPGGLAAPLQSLPSQSLTPQLLPPQWLPLQSFLLQQLLSLQLQLVPIVGFVEGTQPPSINKLSLQRVTLAIRKLFQQVAGTPIMLPCLLR